MKDGTNEKDARDKTADGDRPSRYLQARTAFFDRVVGNALDRGVEQVVVLGADSEHRAQRHARAGVRWWWVEDPGAGLASTLVADGFEPDGPALFTAERLFGSVGPDKAGVVLSELRALACPGTRAALALPASTVATPEELSSWLGPARWQPVQLSERTAKAGFAVLAPQWSPAPPGGTPATLSRIGSYTESFLYRSGGQQLGAHLEATYGRSLRQCRELDVGVFALDWRGGQRWIARVFPAPRPPAAVAADAELLDWLHRAGIAAERPAAEPPVSTHCGQGVLVTERIAGRQLPASADSYELLGQLLGQLHRLAPGCQAAKRPGGAWHHLVADGSPADEVQALRDLWEAAAPRAGSDHLDDYHALGAAMGTVDAGADLPHAVVHPDLVNRNAIRRADGTVVPIDWSGAGWGPRVVSLGCLLWAASLAGPACAEAGAAGYSQEISLTSEELERLPAAARLRPATLAVWAFATGRARLPDALARWRQQELATDTGTRRALDRLRTA